MKFSTIRSDVCKRSYRDEYTGSLPNSEVNRRRARSVLGWGTAWEALWVLLALFVFSKNFESDDAQKKRKPHALVEKIRPL